MNKTLGIVGGIALVGVVGYLIYSRNKAMSSAQSEPLTNNADKSTSIEDQTTSGSTTEPIISKNKKITKSYGVKKIEPKGATGVGKLVEKISGIFGAKAQDKVETVLEDRRERKACRKAAQQACGRKLRAKKCRKDFRKKCIAEGGYDEGGEDFAAFSSSKLSSELEDFAFNGHTF
jgi:hypothetical protein